MKTLVSALVALFVLISLPTLTLAAPASTGTTVITDDEYQAQADDNGTVNIDNQTGNVPVQPQAQQPYQGYSVPQQPQPTQPQQPTNQNQTATTTTTEKHNGLDIGGTLILNGKRPGAIITVGSTKGKAEISTTTTGNPQVIVAGANGYYGGYNGNGYYGGCNTAHCANLSQWYYNAPSECRGNNARFFNGSYAPSGNIGGYRGYNGNCNTGDCRSGSGYRGGGSKNLSQWYYNAPRH